MKKVLLATSALVILCGGVRKRRGPAGLQARAAATANRLDRPLLGR